jgi:hypothetical protein
VVRDHAVLAAEPETPDCTHLCHKAPPVSEAIALIMSAILDLDNQMVYK